MLNLQLARAFHHVERTHEIGFEVGARIFEAVSHTRLPREVDYHVRLFGHCEGVQLLEIFEHADMRAEMLVLHQHLVPPLFQPDVVIVGKAVITDNAEALCQQQLREVIADEPGRSRDEHCTQALSPHEPWPPKTN